MIALSIQLPEHLAEASRRLARKLGISRSELIRRSLAHEIESVEAELERTAMAEGLRALGRNATAIEELETLDNGLVETLPEDKDAWWNG